MPFGFTTYKKHFYTLATYLFTVAILLSQLQTKATSSIILFDSSVASSSSSTVNTFSTYCPGASNSDKQLIYLAEVVAEVNEEEEIGIDSFNLIGLFKSFYHLKEYAYTSSVNSRFINQEFSICKQPHAPLFILYHSWKGYLS